MMNLLTYLFGGFLDTIVSVRDVIEDYIVHCAVEHYYDNMSCDIDSSKEVCLLPY